MHDIQSVAACRDGGMQIIVYECTLCMRMCAILISGVAGVYVRGCAG